MADLKISELVSATSVAVTDYFVIVQSGETRKITPKTLFGNIPSPVYCKEATETVASGVVSLLVSTSVISSASSANQILTLAAGTHGMVKEIVVGVLSNTYTATLNVTGGKGFTSVVFNSVGDTLSLRNISGSWYILGSNGVTIV